MTSSDYSKLIIKNRQTTDGKAMAREITDKKPRRATTDGKKHNRYHGMTNDGRRTARDMTDGT